MNLFGGVAVEDYLTLGLTLFKLKELLIQKFMECGDIERIFQ
jgi:hypothetical protein